MKLLNPFEQFNKKWALLTAGKKEDFNTMTISWGAMGTLWGKACVTVYVKPCRYTYHYMNESDYFTVSFYDETYRKDLSLLGSRSKRDGDKLSLTSLHPEFLDKGITFAEANLTIICKKIYYQDLNLEVMDEETKKRYYTVDAPHRMFIGEVYDIIER